MSVRSSCVFQRDGEFIKLVSDVLFIHPAIYRDVEGMIEIYASFRANGSAGKSRSHGTSFPSYCLADGLIGSSKNSSSLLKNLL